MKAYLVSKKEYPAQHSDDAPRVGVVLQDFKPEYPYSCEEFTVLATPGQLSLLEAFKAVSTLSQGARDRLGITAERLQEMQGQAGPAVELKAGDTMYATVSRLPGIRDMVTGVYAFQPENTPHMIEPLKVYASIGDIIHEDNEKAIDKEIAQLSRSTRQILGMKI